MRSFVTLALWLSVLPFTCSGMMSVSRTPYRRGELYRQVLRNMGETQYVADITVGGQALNGIIDTGSFELLVFSTSCTTCGVANTYDSLKSQNYKPGLLQSVISFGSGDLYAVDGFDSVSVGPLTAENQSVWQVNRAEMSLLDHADFNAIVGVGPPDTPKIEAWTAAALSVANVAVSSRPIGELTHEAVDSVNIALYVSGKQTLLQSFNVTIFSVCLGRQPKSDGFFVWNDLDPKLHSVAFQELPVIAPLEWSVNLTNAHMEYPEGSREEPFHLGCSDGCNAIVDSGTSLLVVPTLVAQRLMEMLHAFDYDCGRVDQMPHLHFNLGGHAFSLPPEAYIGEVIGVVPKPLRSWFRDGGLPFTAEVKCNLLVMSGDEATKQGPMWILGMPFFRYYYTTFHVGGEGRARALYTTPSSDDCHPLAPEAAASLRSGTLPSHVRRVDLSRLRAPHLAGSGLGRK